MPSPAPWTLSNGNASPCPSYRSAGTLSAHIGSSSTEGEDEFYNLVTPRSAQSHRGLQPSSSGYSSPRSNHSQYGPLSPRYQDHHHNSSLSTSHSPLPSPGPTRQQSKSPSKVMFAQEPVTKVHKPSGPISDIRGDKTKKESASTGKLKGFFGSLKKKKKDTSKSLANRTLLPGPIAEEPTTSRSTPFAGASQQKLDDLAAFESDFERSDYEESSWGSYRAATPNSRMTPSPQPLRSLKEREVTSMYEPRDYAPPLPSVSLPPRLNSANDLSHDAEVPATLPTSSTRRARRPSSISNRKTSVIQRSESSFSVHSEHGGEQWCESPGWGQVGPQDVPSAASTTAVSDVANEEDRDAQVANTDVPAPSPHPETTSSFRDPSSSWRRDTIRIKNSASNPRLSILLPGSSFDLGMDFGSFGTSDLATSSAARGTGSLGLAVLEEGAEDESNSVEEETQRRPDRFTTPVLQSSSGWGEAAGNASHATVKRASSRRGKAPSIDRHRDSLRGLASLPSSSSRSLSADVQSVAR